MNFYQVGVWLWLHGRSIGETAKAWTEVLAYASAAGYFLYRLSRGYFFPNLSVQILSDRKESPKEGRDYLAITVRIEKGDRGTVRIHDVQYRIDDRDASSLSGMERLTYVKTETGGKALFGTISRSAPRLNFTPGERAEFSIWCEVTSTDPHVIEVVVLGRQLHDGSFSQWRSSAVSLPKAGEPGTISVLKMHAEEDSFMRYHFWKAANDRYSSEDRLAVCIEPEGHGVLGYACREDSTWIIEGDELGRIFQTEHEAASTLVRERGSAL